MKTINQNYLKRVYDFKRKACRLYGRVGQYLTLMCRDVLTPLIWVRRCERERHSTAEESSACWSGWSGLFGCRQSRYEMQEQRPLFGESEGDHRALGHWLQRF